MNVDVQHAVMARALALAARGRYTTHPNPRVGAIVVKDGIIVGEGYHVIAGEPHAEVHALAQAAEHAKGADMYVTLEPCNHQGRTPACTHAVIAAGIKRVYVAMQDPNPKVAGSGIAALRAAGVQVVEGIRRAEALRLNRPFVHRMLHKRPWVTLKLGASIDGRTADAHGKSQWITSAEARRDVHRLRAEAGAVLTSSNTVIADDPMLSVRLSADELFQWSPLPDVLTAQGGDSKFSPFSLLIRQPDRIVIDSHSRVAANAKVWSGGARRFWFTSPQSLFALSLGTVTGQNQVPVFAVDGDEAGNLRLDTVLRVLASREVNQVLIESGPILAGAFLKAGLVDELVLYMAPTLMGHMGRSLAVLPGFEHLHQRLAWNFDEVHKVGPDLRIAAIPERVEEF